MAAPAAAPAIMPSVRGVSRTRFSPYLANSPSVAPKTPPFLPTSSPMTMTRSSRSISSSMAVRMASSMFSSAMSVGASGGGVVRVHVPLRRRGIRIRACLGAAARLVDLLFRGSAVLRGLRVVEQPPLPQLGGEAGERILLLERFHLRRVAIAPLVVVRRVAGEPHHTRVDHGRAPSPAGAVVGLLGCRVAGQRVGAVDQHAGEAIAIR